MTSDDNTALIEAIRSLNVNIGDLLAEFKRARYRTKQTVAAAWAAQELENSQFLGSGSPDAIESLPALEKRSILKALVETRGDILSAARGLGIGKTTMYRKLRQYNKMGNSNDERVRVSVEAD